MCLHFTARCHHSYKKNDTPHSLECDIVMTNDTSSACSCYCTCAIGNSGCCGHVIGLLFQLAQYTMLKLRTVPDVVACTSLLQQWHKPRGAKIEAIRTDDMKLASSSQEKEKTRPVRTTLYNPIANCCTPSYDDFRHTLADTSPDCQWLTLSGTAELVQTKLGYVPKGSVLSYQQMADPVYSINFIGVDFPDMPVENLLSPMRQDLTADQANMIEAVALTYEQSVLFEKETRTQSDNTLWHKLRESRITASKIGLICKRQKGTYLLCIIATLFHCAFLDVDICNCNIVIYLLTLHISILLRIDSEKRMVFLGGHPAKY